MENNFYIELLLGDLESFIITEKKRIDRIVSKNDDISIEDTVFVLDKLSKSLKKTENILDLVDEVDSSVTLKGISILASETIAWILFTLPSVEKNLPYFDDVYIYNKNIIDYLADILLEFESFIENPSKMKFLSKDLRTDIKNISMTINHYSDILKKGLIEN